MGIAADASDAPADASAEVLATERKNLARILEVHRGQVAAARRRAERLADEAATATEEGIRDLIDEDDEADTSVRAALVRQSADAAMHAVKRVLELDEAGEALAFGHVTDDDDERLHVGRISVIDGDEALLVDWRARASIPFYRATPVERLGVRRRRHLLYGEVGGPDDLVGYSDEVFDVDALHEEVGLRGEAAILASVTAPTEAQMRSVVATIQAEQDAVVRAPTDRPLVVQGGPGTGKTVVALHRAAFLLYDQRVQLAETGVLVVGPSTQFLSYISGVLPSLGESGVVSATIPELLPGILVGAPEPAELAELKGELIMVDLLAEAVRDRQRPPKEDLLVDYGTTRVRLALDELRSIRRRAQGQPTHNAGAAAFRAGVIEALCHQVDDEVFDTFDDARQHFSELESVEWFCLRHWPTLTPEQALNDLFGSEALLRSAGHRAGVRPEQLAALHRPRVSQADLDDRRWTDADVPLLDELFALVGPVIPDDAVDEMVTRRDEADEFELADAAADEVIELDEDDDDTVSLDDPRLVDADLDLDTFDERFWDRDG
ncbi:MAG: hypothetical protein AAFZ07_07365 [Actinomycetota bacterium]